MAKELVEIAGRKYRLCEDAHLAISEKKQLVWINNGKVFPLRVGSTNYGPRKGVLFIYDAGREMGDGSFCWYPDWKYNMLVYIDVTPEKRYAVWNKKYQRFTLPPRHAETTEVFKSRSEAEAWINSTTAADCYSVVEFDNPDSEQ